MKKFVIIAAAGRGERLGGEVPKQFLVLNDRPVLMHSISRFFEYDKDISIVVAMPESEIVRWEKLVYEFSFDIPCRIVTGGSSRFQSVKNALELVESDSLVAIHDGVRPLCSLQLIKRCFDGAEKNKCAIPVIPVTDTILEIKGNSFTQVARENFRAVQTPQCFDSTLLKAAYAKSMNENITDDAGVFKSAGNEIFLVDGERQNLKITERMDLTIAENIINATSQL